MRTKNGGTFEIYIFSFKVTNQKRLIMTFTVEKIGGKMSSEARAMKNLYPEEIFQEFEGDDASWWQFDSRVNWLLEKKCRIKR